MFPPLKISHPGFTDSSTVCQHTLLFPGGVGLYTRIISEKIGNAVQRKEHKDLSVTDRASSKEQTIHSHLLSPRASKVHHLSDNSLLHSERKVNARGTATPPSESLADTERRHLLRSSEGFPIHSQRIKCISCLSGA